MNEQKKSVVFSILAGCLFATYALYYLVNYLQWYSIAMLLPLLTLSVPIAMAVMLLMRRTDWVFLGVTGGCAMATLINYISDPSIYTFLFFAATLGINAIAFLKIRNITIYKYFFYAPAVLLMLATLASGGLINCIITYGWYEVDALLSALFELIRVAAYLFTGFWLYFDGAEAKSPAMPFEAAQAPARFCVKCGTKNNVQDVFCAQCGSRLH